MTKSLEENLADKNKSQINKQGYIVAANFSKKASNYERFAKVQKFAARHLDEQIGNSTNGHAPARILEIGCGTGLLSRYLVNRFPNSKIEFLDPSSHMLQLCEQNLYKDLAIKIPSPNYSFIEKSIEDHLNDKNLLVNKYTIIASSFTLHWLTNLPVVIDRLIDKLEIGGQIFFTYPTNKSFPEWKAVCKLLNLPFTGNKFPAIEDVATMVKSKQASIIWNEYCFKFNLPDSLQFFKEIKNLGAETLIQSYKTNKDPTNRQLSVPEFRRLTKTWNQQFPTSVNMNAIRDTSNHLVDCTYWLVEGIITRHS